MRVILSVVLVVLFSSAAQAQMHNHQPYAGMETRSIKALSDQQIADLRDGRGLAAELNGYPGPSHVLEQAEALKLTAAQQEEIQALFNSMQAEARAIGLTLIAQEGELDSLFARHEIDSEKLVNSTRAIGETQALLRATHLKYHLTTAELLTLSKTNAMPS